MNTKFKSEVNRDVLINTITNVQESLSLIIKILMGSDSTKAITILEYTSMKILSMKSHTFLNRGEPYTENAILNWVKFYNVWNAFSKEQCKEFIFDDISMNTYNDFISFCDSLQFRQSTKCLYITILKAVMSYAFTDGTSNNRLFTSRNFRSHLSYRDNTKIYLTHIEINKIEQLNLKNKSTLDKVRDVFLIGCYTGLRVSDYSTLTIQDIETIEMNGNKYQIIRKKQKKTGNEVIIPILNNKILAILKKWGEMLPKTGLSTINDRIKTICYLAGITDTIKKYDNIGGIDKIEVTTKDRMVSSHTARRSCITNLYLDGKLDIVQIMSISGHKTEQAFFKYLCYSSEECAKRIIENLKVDCHVSYLQ